MADMTDGGIDMRRFLLGAAAALLLWQLALWLSHFTSFGGIWMAKLFYATQDFPVLVAGAAVLMLASLRRWDGSPPQFSCRFPKPGFVIGALLVVVLVGWAGHYLVFSGYALSRDEDMAVFAGQYLGAGRLGAPIPPLWQPYGRAMMPIFYSAFGAGHVWTSVYLPLNSAARAALAWADPDLASPLFTALGLFSLWRVALRWFPDRPDAVWVTLLMGLSSAQLLAMAMTPYAAAAHFGLEMAWLALALGAGRGRQAGAMLLIFAATGLHQWHFTPLFATPFIAWFLLRRRWGVALVQGGALAVAILFWIKGWPMLLEHVNGAAAPGVAPPHAGVAAKVGRLFDRLDEMQPLFSLARFMAWNNLLLLPLAACAVPTLWRRWPAVLRGVEPVLPLLVAVALGLGLMLYQVHGWGYRYFHALIGPWCLLAGYGWLRLSGARGQDGRGLGVVRFAAALAGFSGLFLLVRAHDFVAPYAAADARIRTARADVVLVDWRGGVYTQDLVRFHGDDSGGDRGDAGGRPAVMGLQMLTPDQVDMLCATHDVAIFDWRDFRAAGIPSVPFAPPVSAIRAHMAARGCGHPVGAR